ELSLVCEQSTSLVPKLRRGEIDLALATRDRAGTGSLLFGGPRGGVAAAAHQAGRREPLPLALYEPGSRARKLVTAALAAQRRLHRVVYHSPSLAGQIAAAESGLAVAVLTRCSVPAGLMVLDKRHGLPVLPPLDVVVLRSRASAASEAAQAMHEQLLLTLGRADEDRQPGNGVGRVTRSVKAGSAIAATAGKLVARATPAVRVDAKASAPARRVRGG